MFEALVQLVYCFFVFDLLVIEVSIFALEVDLHVLVFVAEVAGILESEALAFLFGVAL